MTSSSIVRHTFNTLGLVNAPRYYFSEKYLARKSFALELEYGRIYNPKFVQVSPYHRGDWHPAADRMVGLRTMGFKAAAYLHAANIALVFAPVAQHGAVSPWERALLAQADGSTGFKSLGLEAVALGVRLVLLPFRLLAEAMYVHWTLTGASIGIIAEAAAKVRLTTKLYTAKSSSKMQPVRTVDALAMQEQRTMNDALNRPLFFVGERRDFFKLQDRIASYIRQTETQGALHNGSNEATNETKKTVTHLFDAFPYVDQDQAISNLVETFKIHTKRQTPFLQGVHPSDNTIGWAIERLIKHATAETGRGEPALWSSKRNDLLAKRSDGADIKAGAVYATIWHALKSLQPENAPFDEQKRQLRLRQQELFFIALANKVDRYGNVESLSEVEGVLAGIRDVLPAVPKLSDDAPLSPTQWAADAYAQLHLPPQASPMLIRTRFELAYRTGMNLWPESHHAQLAAELADMARSKHHVEWIAGDL